MDHGSDVRGANFVYSELYGVDTDDSEDENDEAEQLTPLGDLHDHQAATANINFLARLRHNFATSPLGSFLNQNSSRPIQNHSKPSLPAQEQGQHALKPLDYSNSPTVPTPRCLSELQRTSYFSSPKPQSQRHSPSQKRDTGHLNSTPKSASFSSSTGPLAESPPGSSQATLISSVSGSTLVDSSLSAHCASDAQTTPPLTPDLFAESQSLSSAYSHDDSPQVYGHGIYIKDDKEENDKKSGSEAMNKKGKDAAPPLVRSFMQSVVWNVHQTRSFLRMPAI